MTDRKFYKTTFSFEVLPEEPIPDMDLSDILAECVAGGYSLGDIRRKQKQLDGKKCAAELLAQGSDPGFFQLDEEGNHDDDEDEA